MFLKLSNNNELYNVMKSSRFLFNIKRVDSVIMTRTHFMLNQTYLVLLYSSFRSLFVGLVHPKINVSKARKLNRMMNRMQTKM